MRAQRKQLFSLQEMKLKLQLSLWFPVTAYAALIFYLSSLTSVPGPDIPFLDKALHAIEYGLLGFLLMRAIFRAGFRLDRRSAFAFAVIIGFIYGVGDEIHQILVAGRTASFFDALFDLIGASLGSHLYPRSKIL